MNLDSRIGQTTGVAIGGVEERLRRQIKREGALRGSCLVEMLRRKVLCSALATDDGHQRTPRTQIVAIGTPGAISKGRKGIGESA